MKALRYDVYTRRGVESLIEHPASMTHASIPAERRAAIGVGDGLIRLSVGIEDDADLIADLGQALESVEAWTIGVRVRSRERLPGAPDSLPAPLYHESSRGIEGG